jgi:type IV fimbrial biogenesis protein FimT
MSHAITLLKKVRSPHPPSRPGGFTLIELMVTISVAAIMIALAAPSFASIFNINRLTGTANELLATLQSARIEAVRRNLRTVVCRSDDGATCNTASGDWGGWISFVDTDRSGVFNTGDVLLRTNTITAPVRVTASPAISGDSSRVSFGSDGFAHATNGTMLTATVGVCIVTAQPDLNTRDVAIATGSRVSVVSPPLRRATCAAPGN